MCVQRECGASRKNCCWPAIVGQSRGNDGKRTRVPGATESDLRDSDPQSTLPQDLTQDWYDEDPVAEVWSGDREDFADGLLACFRELESHRVSLLKQATGAW